MTHPQFTLGSLFSGIGGLEYGLEMTGAFKTVWQVEQSEYCRKVLRKHWPDALQFEDVRNVGRENLPAVDVICGGFPCQDISQANTKDFRGLDGDRSGLWFEYARIVRELRPKYIVVENVSALIIRGLDRVLGTLAELGYDAEWSMLPACALGASHPRERVFLVAYPHGQRFAQPFPTRRAVSVADRQGLTLHRDNALVPRLALEPSARDGRARDGISHRLDTLAIGALGNAVVPQCARVIGEWLLEIDAELSEGAA